MTPQYIKEPTVGRVAATFSGSVVEKSGDLVFESCLIKDITDIVKYGNSNPLNTVENTKIRHDKFVRGSG